MVTDNFLLKIKALFITLCACQGSNLGPTEYQSIALPSELHAHSENITEIFSMNNIDFHLKFI